MERKTWSISLPSLLSIYYLNHRHDRLFFLIEAIHLNDKYPENQNIKLTNIKSNYVKVKRDGEWEIDDKQKILDDIIMNKTQILSDNFEENKEKYDLKYPSNKINGVAEVFNMIENEDKNILKDIKKDTSIKFVNHSKKSKAKVKKNKPETTN